MTDLTLARYWKLLQSRDVAKVVEAADHTEAVLHASTDERNWTPGVRESVPLEDILAGTAGPELGALPGMTAEEAESYAKAIDRT